MKLKFLFFGIDGASHNLMAKMFSAGLLPNLQRLKETGPSCMLESTFPPHTAPGWTSMFTGTSPGTHGIYQFWRTKDTDYRAKAVGFNDVPLEPIWKTLERFGFRVGVVNVPMTHPPCKLNNGFMISWPLSKTIHYSEPKEIISDLVKKNLHYQSDLMLMYRNQNDFITLMCESIAKRTLSLFYLVEKYPIDALFVVYTEVDRISHYFWDDNFEQADYLKQVYQATDKALGDLLSLTDQSTIKVVASDHGFGNCRYNFNVHTFLENHNLLKTRFFLVQEKKETGEDNLNWYYSSSLYRKEIDWKNTLFYMPTAGSFGLNINLYGREKEGRVLTNEIPELENKIKFLINTEVIDPDNGEPVFALKCANDVYHGENVSLAPDYILFPRKWDIMPHPAITDSIWGSPTQYAIHRLDGVFYASGGELVKNDLGSCPIEAVTPFILTQLGLPLSHYMYGNTLIPSVKEIRWETPVSYNHAAPLLKEEAAALEQRLSDLGYM